MLKSIHIRMRSQLRYLKQRRNLPQQSVKPGKYDLILHPTHLWLTIHESIGHPTELDRILGYEANFAGTSFLRKKDVADFTYGSDHP